MNKNLLYLLPILCLVSSLGLAQQRYFGVNLAGAEFSASQDGGPNLPGTYNVHYTYPNQNEVDYFQSKNMNIVRLCFRWERLQRSLNANFDATELSRLNTFVTETTEKGVFVLLDPHNYARYNGDIIGSNAVPNSAFAGFWTKLADLYKNNEYVIFGLMNEPSRMETVQWRISANIAISAIRDTGATNLILVPGNGFTGGHSWLQNWYAEESPNSNSIGPNGYRVGSNAEEMLNIVDPLNNYAFDIHQYLDSDFSGTDESCVSATIGSEKLAELNEWLTTHNKKAFLGEFGAGDSQTCLAALSDITTYINDRPETWIGWSYWAAGPWWGDYFTSLEPDNLNSPNPIDKPQLASLIFELTSLSPISPDLLNFNHGLQQITFPSILNQSYQLYTSTTLLEGSWNEVGSSFSGDGSLITIPLQSQQLESPKRFYQIGVSN